MFDVTFTTKFCRLAALRQGRIGATPVLALHGWLDNAATFKPLAHYLGQELDLVAIDLPGHGHSDHRSVDASYLFVDWVREVFAAADACGWKQFHILGHSMGAGVATLAAVADPSRVLSVLGLDGFMPVTSEANELAPRLRDYVRDALRDRRQISFPSEQDALAIRARAGQFEHLNGLKEIVDRNTVLKDGRWYLRSDRRLMTHNPLRLNPDQLDRLAAELKAPIHIIVADDGLEFVKEQVVRLGPLIKEFSFEKVAGFHHVHLDAPERLAPLVEKYYRRFSTV